MGPYPLERLKRSSAAPDLNCVPAMRPVTYVNPDKPENLGNAMRVYGVLLDALRDGPVRAERAEITSDAEERSNNLKAFAYYHGSTQAGVCRLLPEMFLDEPISNSGLARLPEEFQARPTKVPMLKAIAGKVLMGLKKPPQRVDHHTHALVLLFEYPRNPRSDEAGCDWIQDAQAERASVLAAEGVVVVADYIRQLGFEARAHTGSCSDVDLNKLAVQAGLAEVADSPSGPILYSPYVDKYFGLAAITTTYELATDLPLAASSSLSIRDRWRSHGPAWWLGSGANRSALNARPFHRRRFKDGAYPFERIRRVEQTTTVVDEPRIPRTPKRSDMFARAAFGDLGKAVPDANRNIVDAMVKSINCVSYTQIIAAVSLLQGGQEAPSVSDTARDAQQNADNIKAALYFLGADAVGISRCPDWAYYSHDSEGDEITPYHKNAISVIVDQGFETMQGASGDDWVGAAQSARAYLRFALLGGIVTEQIRSLGYSARSHTVFDGEVVQPPLLLLSGLGEVSRIGDVILNPFLGPRLKSGVITTNMPLTHDKPIDFGLQNFCSNCNKCARECPSGSISAGKKVMFNGYEMWKPDSQKCTQYRITNPAGSTCGRCMKTCPWNLEGLFADAPFRWLASNVPGAAKILAKLDDKLGRGKINPVKKWWWDLEKTGEGPYLVTKNGVNRRELQTELELKPEEQTIALYPVELAPPPAAYPYPMDRDAGVAAAAALLSPQEYKEKLAKGDTDNLVAKYQIPKDAPKVEKVKISHVERMSDSVSKYEFSSLDGAPLPAFEAGAHIDVVVAPNLIRQYSLSGDPADSSKYQIGVLREDEGRGGSKMLHMSFHPGRPIVVSHPINHFPLDESATKTYLMGGGIGITPMIAMAHRLHAIGADFVLHYSCSTRDDAGFLEDLAAVPWADNVRLHISSEGTRINLDAVLDCYEAGYHVYTCGPDRYMSSVLETADKCGWPEPVVHKEYFSVPEEPEYENHEFTLKLARSGREIAVPAEKNAADALIEAGVPVVLKCSDGLCGTCQCGLISGEAEHRDFVLTKAQREDTIILCKSRAAAEHGVVEIDL